MSLRSIYKKSLIARLELRHDLIFRVKMYVWCESKEATK